MNTIKDDEVETGSGNVFADVGLPEEYLLRAEIVRWISNMIEQRGLSQKAAGSIMGLRQPDVSKLLRGEFDGFSIERLLSFVQAFGSDVEIKIKSARTDYRGRIVMTA